MHETPHSLKNPSAGPGNTMPAVLVLLGASGCASMWYATAWNSLLQPTIGSAGASAALTACACLVGFGIGSIGMSGRLPAEHPLRFYGVMELAVATAGILGFFGISFSIGMPAALLFTLPASMLMGMLLPAMCRGLDSVEAGFAFAAFIAGTAIGSVLAGFKLLPEYGPAGASFAAFALHAIVGGISLAIVRWISAGRKLNACNASGKPRQYALTAGLSLSGLSIAGAMTVWCRLLSLIFGASVFTSCIVFSIFLAGLAAGAGLGSAAAARTTCPRIILGFCQLALAPAIAWTAYMLAESISYWPIDPLLALNPRFNFHMDILRTSCAIQPATLLWGAILPLSMAGSARTNHFSARGMGQACGATAVGAAIGALLFPIALIPDIGTQHLQQLLIVFSLIAALLSLAPIVSRRQAGWLAAALTIAATLIWSVSELPWQTFAYGRRMATMLRSAELSTPGIQTTQVLYRGEGINSSILATAEKEQRTLYVNGMAEASTTPADIRIQRMAAHLPALIGERPHSVLVTGFAAGITAGTLGIYPGIQKIVISEPERLLLASAPYFQAENKNIVNDPRVAVVNQNARQYLRSSEEAFDVITSDAFNPRVNSALFTREYFELCKKHLSRGGVIAQWLPLYDSGFETVKTELATFFSVFPNATIWSNTGGAEARDLILIGQASASLIDLDRLQERLELSDYAAVAQSLSAAGFHSAAELLATYTGRASDLNGWLGHIPVNLDTIFGWNTRRAWD